MELTPSSNKYVYDGKKELDEAMEKLNAAAKAFEEASPENKETARTAALSAADNVEKVIKALYQSGGRRRTHRRRRARKTRRHH
jgi:ssDNA-binding replication factor A large subunit